MKYIRTNGIALEYQPGGPDDDPWWKEVLLYGLVATAFFVLLYAGVAVSRWVS